ncbi:MAG: class I SAM-dependent methyltransferase [Acidobacteriota bacterium]
MIDRTSIQNSNTEVRNEDGTFAAMDGMYRFQRYFYDLTRKYYLLGRDRLIDEMEIDAGDRVLEIGCGTGRNLILLGRKRPEAKLYGLDASSEMLVTAKEKIAKRGHDIDLRTALADDFAFDSTFGLEKPFDVVFFSYSISMIPTWLESIENAFNNLKPGGALYIVDFYDQKDLPGWFQKLLQEWLKKFHVQFWHDLMPYLKSLETRGLGVFTFTPLYRRYSFIASFKKL